MKFRPQTRTNSGMETALSHGALHLIRGLVYSYHVCLCNASSMMGESVALARKFRHALEYCVIVAWGDQYHIRLHLCRRRKSIGGNAVKGRSCRSEVQVRPWDQITRTEIAWYNSKHELDLGKGYTGSQQHLQSTTKLPKPTPCQQDTQGSLRNINTFPKFAEYRTQNKLNTNSISSEVFTSLFNLNSSALKLAWSTTTEQSVSRLPKNVHHTRIRHLSKFQTLPQDPCSNRQNHPRPQLTWKPRVYSSRRWATKSRETRETRASSTYREYSEHF